MLKIDDPESPLLVPQKKDSSEGIREFRVNRMTLLYDYLEQSLNYVLVDWHQTGSKSQIVARLQKEVTSYENIYSPPKPDLWFIDEFEMHLLMAVALTNEVAIAERLKKEISFAPKGNDYGYYVGFKQALLGLMLGDEDLKTSGRENLSNWNAVKRRYYPTNKVIFAALDGDLTTLKAQAKTVSVKFEGYAKKTGALVEDRIQLGKMQKEFRAPYPDWAFFAQAIRHFGAVDAKETFFMPMSLLNSFAS